MVCLVQDLVDTTVLNVLDQQVKRGLQKEFTRLAAQFAVLGLIHVDGRALQ